MTPEDREAMQTAFDDWLALTDDEREALEAESDELIPDDVRWMVPASGKARAA